MAQLPAHLTHSLYGGGPTAVAGRRSTITPTPTQPSSHTAAAAPTQMHPKMSTSQAMGSYVQREEGSELEEILIPPAATIPILHQQQQAQQQLRLTIDPDEEDWTSGPSAPNTDTVEDFTFSDEEDEDDEEDGDDLRPAIGAKKKPSTTSPMQPSARTLQQPPSAIYLPTNMTPAHPSSHPPPQQYQSTLLGTAHQRVNSQVTSANMSNVSVRVRGLHSPSHSLSGLDFRPITPEHNHHSGSGFSDESEMALLSQQAHLQTNHNSISPGASTTLKVGTQIHSHSVSASPTNTTLFTPDHPPRPSSTNSDGYDTRATSPSLPASGMNTKRPAGLSIQTNSSALQLHSSAPDHAAAPASAAIKTAGGNSTPQVKGHHRRGVGSWGSWTATGDEMPTPKTAFPGTFIPSSMGGTHMPPNTADRERTSTANTKIHVVRIKEKKEEKFTQGFGRTPPIKRGHGNYKMPNNPYYKNQNQINRERDLGILKEKETKIVIEDDEDESTKQIPLGDTPWHHKLEMPVYRVDGELDANYLARKTRHRQKLVLVSFGFFISVFLLLEVPYVLFLFASDPTTPTQNQFGQVWKSKWELSSNLGSLLARVGLGVFMLLGILYGRFRYKRDLAGYNLFLSQQPDHRGSIGLVLAAQHTSTYRFFPMDQYIGVLTCLCGIGVIVLEGFRDSSFRESDLLIEDGVLLGLTLLLTYMIGILRLPKLQCVIQAILIIAVFTGCFYIPYLYPDRSDSYIMKSDGYLVLLVVSLGIYHSQLRAYAKADLDKRKAQNFERRKADKLLRSMLPGTVYSTVLEGRNPYLSGIATIGFCNVELSYDENAKPSPAELMQRLHDTFKRIDGIVAVYKGRGVYKIETVSKTYLLCCGLLEEIEDHAASMVDVCIEIMHMIQGRNMKSTNSKITSGLKIGIATGPVVGGIIGTQRRFFRVFGDTVNVSARMCTNCSTWQIQCNKYAYDSLNEIQRSQYKFPPSRILSIKGKGEMECYLVDKRDDWVPRFGKAVMNRGSLVEEENEEGAAKEFKSSFVFHKIVKATSLKAFPLLRYRSTFEHHDAELLKAEGPSANTSEHIEYRYQIHEFNMWMPRTKLNIAWFFVWMLLAFAFVAYQKIHVDFSNSLGNIGLSLPILFSTMLVMIAIHFISSYTLASYNYYKKHTQTFTGIYAFGISSWILVALSFWGLNDGPIAPHFAYILLNLYTSLYLHLQLRFTVPLMMANLIGFLIILILKHYSVWDIIFCMSYLTVCTVFILFGTWKAENRIRANYLIQYAFDMEQGQMDNFLKNLLPQFVVNVLKKQSPAGNKSRTTQRGSVVMDSTLRENEDKTREDSAGSRNTSLISRHRDSPPQMTPAHARRRSVFDVADVGARGGGGGLASRFAMNFPNATVFESDIVRNIHKHRMNRVKFESLALNSLSCCNFSPLCQVGYTKLVSDWPAQRTLNMLNELFSMFDDVAQKCAVEKIETIGDAFMCVVFEDEPDAVLNFALDVLAGLRAMNKQRAGETPIEIRSGVCTGPCYGGVVGSDVPRFHMFGVAHDGSVLLEQNGRPGTAMVSGATYTQACTRYKFERRADIQCEHIEVYQLMGRTGSDEQVEKDIFNAPSPANSITSKRPPTNQPLLTAANTVSTVGSPSHSMGPKKGWV